MSDNLKAKQMVWHPIETAPKDGTEVLLYRADCGVLLGRWDCLEYILPENHSDRKEFSEEDLWKEDWFYADMLSGGRLEGGEVPTHWMPLPEEPA